MQRKCAEKGIEGPLFSLFACTRVARVEGGGCFPEPRVRAKSEKGREGKKMLSRVVLGGTLEGSPFLTIKLDGCWYLNTVLRCFLHGNLNFQMV